MTKINKTLMLGILLLAVVVPMTTYLAVTNQNPEREAAGDTSGTVYVAEVVDGVCGSVNGTKVSFLPGVRDACAKGAVNWMDTEATDGDYNWDCFGTTGKGVAHCSATKE